MTWQDGGGAARELLEALTRAVAKDGVDLASAAIEKQGIATAILPESQDPERRFEIGSVSKTLTATLLALLVDEGALELEAPIGRWLDAGAHASVTVRELATHTSGLPAMAPNVQGSWAGYGFAEAEAGLRMSTRVPEGERAWRYSNLGYQLLALALERAADRAFDELLTERVLAPLGMADSVIGDGHPLGAGGVEATIDDLARYAGAVLVPPGGPLGNAISVTLRGAQVRIDAGTEQALAWVVRRGGEHEVCEHSGGTAGYTACVSVSRDAGRAVALLAATGGSPALASHFKRAALLAIAGRDPSEARTPDPFPDWRQRVEGVVRALIRGDVDGVYGMLAAPTRARIKSSDVGRAWEARTWDAGAATGNSDTGRYETVRQEQAVSGAIVVDLMIEFEYGRVGVRTMVLPTGELGGISFLPKTD